MTPSSLLAPLDDDQQRLFDRIIAFTDRCLSTSQRPAVFLVQGAAGTGKSVLLSHLLVALTERARSAQAPAPLAHGRIRMLVNHAEMWRRYRELAERTPVLRKAQVLRPTPFINAAARDEAKQADVALVDEAHLLLTRPDPYTRFHGSNQLADIIAASRVTIVVYDDAQVLRMRAQWTPKLLDEVIGRAAVERGELTRQHRMGASLAVRDWIDRTVSGRAPVEPPPAGDGDFGIRVFDDAGALYRAIRSHDGEGSARMLSTYDYPYTLDGGDHFIDEPGLHIRWDRYRPDEPEPWTTRADTVDEVGSVYTVQGLDLDWAGVLLGPSVALSSDGRLRMLPERYEDRAALNGVTALRARGWSDGDVEQARERILRDALLTLLTRARRGLGLYVHDQALAAALGGRPRARVERL